MHCFYVAWTMTECQIGRGVRSWEVKMQCWEVDSVSAYERCPLAEVVQLYLHYKEKLNSAGAP